MGRRLMVNYLILGLIFLLTACSVSSKNVAPKPFCHEFKDGDRVIVPVTYTIFYQGVIVFSDRNPDPCQRLYLLLLEDYFNRPFLIHYNDVMPAAVKRL